MPEVKIGGEARENISINVLSRARSSDTDYWDGNWLNTEVEVNAGGFKGRVRGELRAEEVVDFRDQVAALARSLEGRATFTTMEGWLTVGMRGDGKGHIELEGELRDESGVGNHLSFHFDLDQTFLPRLLAELDAVAKRFPVRGARDA